LGKEEERSLKTETPPPKKELLIKGTRLKFSLWKTRGEREMGVKTTLEVGKGI